MRCPHCGRKMTVPPHDHADDFYNDDNIFNVPSDAAGFMVGDEPAVLGSGGTWGPAHDTNNMYIMDMVKFKGDLYACGEKYIFRRRGGVWSTVYTNANYIFHSLCVFNETLFVGIESIVAFDSWKMIVDYSITGDSGSWANAYTSTTFAANCYVSKLFVWNGSMYAGLYQQGVRSSADGFVWGSAGATTGTYYDLFTHNGNMYAANWSAKTIKQFDGTATWTTVYTSTYYAYCGFSWNGKLYVSMDGGYIAYSITGAAGTWAEVLVASSIQPGFKFAEWNAKLIVGQYDKAYQSSDGVTWTAFYDHTEAESFCFCEYEGLFYCGVGNHSSGTEGYIYVYTDTTYEPQPPAVFNGDVTIYGRFLPNGAAGVAGDLIQSGGAAPPTTLPTGADGTYLAGATSGGPIYQAIPASDVVNTPAGNIAATDVQAALNELDTEKAAVGAVPKITTKTDTGDPVSGTEFEICINTFDNNVKIYADGAWRLLTIW